MMAIRITDTISIDNNQIKMKENIINSLLRQVEKINLSSN
jgi:hypothetical protein